MSDIMSLMAKYDVITEEQREAINFIEEYTVAKFGGKTRTHATLFISEWLDEAKCVYWYLNDGRYCY